MSEFDLLRNITIGQYLPTGSYLHRLDPRAKILAALLLTVAVSFTPTVLGNLCLLAACAGLVWLGRIPPSYALRGLVPALPFLVLLAVLQLLFFGRNYDPASPVIFERGWVVITAAVARLVVVSAARFVELLAVTSVFTLSTRTTELTHGVESLLRPLRRLRVPSHELALVATIAVRFIPTFALEAERLLKAQASRGGRLRGGRWNFVASARRLVPILVPLFTYALKRGEELIVAMEARAYTGGEGRTAYTVLRSTWRDWLAPLATLAFSFFILRAPFPF